MELTHDSPRPGLVVAQPRRGHRYGSEAFWLAGWALGVPGATVLDLGAGSGIVGALLAAEGRRVRGVERWPGWVPLWPTVVASPAVGGRLELVVGDVRDGVEGVYDLVVANPPWFDVDQGPVSPDPARAVARTSDEGNVDAFVRCGLAALAPGGTMVFVGPQDRLDVWTGPVVERIRIGRRLALVVWGAGSRRPDRSLDERDPEVVGWAARARGRG